MRRFYGRSLLSVKLLHFHFCASGFFRPGRGDWAENKQLEFAVASCVALGWKQCKHLKIVFISLGCTNFNLHKCQYIFSNYFRHFSEESLGSHMFLNRQSLKQVKQNLPCDCHCQTRSPPPCAARREVGHGKGAFVQDRERKSPPCWCR